MQIMKWPAVILIILALSTVAISHAQEIEPGPPAKIVSKTYDVRSLCMPVPDYPLPASMLPTDDRSAARQRERDPQGPEGSGELSPMSIAKLIAATVAPESWKDAGGVQGKVAEFQGMLVITQTEANHQKIADLLAQLKADLRRTVRIEATWVLLSAKELNGLQHVAGHESLVEVPDEALKAAKVYCRAQTIGFSGQVVHLATNAKRAYVAEVTPVAQGNVVTYDPRFATANSGVSLQMKPQLNGDQSGVVIDLYSIVTEAPEGSRLDLTHATTRPAGGNADPTALQLMNVLQQQFRTTVSMPLRTNVLIGGITMEPDAKAEPARQLYLVLRGEADKK